MERISVVSRVCGCALFDWIAEQSDGGEGALWSTEQRRPTATAAIVAIFSQFAKDLGGTSVVRVRFDQPAAALPQSDAASASTASGAAASSTAAALAASKRGSTRTFPRYGQTIHSRALFSGPPGAAGRRPTTANGSSPAADDDGRGSVAAIGGAYNTSPFAPAGTAQQPNSPTSPTLAASSSQLSTLTDGGAVRFDMYCADNDAILIAAFVTPIPQQLSTATSGAPLFSSHSEVEATCVKLRDAFQARFNGTLQQMHNTFMTMARNTDESLVNESFLPHFTLFADTMREMGYVHYHNQQPVSAPANVAIGQPTDQSTATHMTPAVLIAADTAGTSNGTTGSQQQIEQQNGETAIVPG